MKIKRSLTLDTAARIVDLCLDTATKAGVEPLCVVVLDSGGIPGAVKSQDGCGILRFDVALGKAYGALGMGTSGRNLGERLAARPNFASALVGLSGGRFVPNPGGVLILDNDGIAIGAIGVSGDTSDKDEYCAITAIHAAGLGSEPASCDQIPMG
jgi:uncharacterized protein GlcG (DUF336 family)